MINDFLDILNVQAWESSYLLPFLFNFDLIMGRVDFIKQIIYSAFTYKKSGLTQFDCIGRLIRLSTFLLSGFYCTSLRSQFWRTYYTIWPDKIKYIVISNERTDHAQVILIFSENRTAPFQLN